MRISPAAFLCKLTAQAVILPPTKSHLYKLSCAYIHDTKVRDRVLAFLKYDNLLSSMPKTVNGT